LKRVLRGVAILLLGGLVVFLIVWFALYGPRHLSRYPKVEGSPYVLPFRGPRWVCQGNNGIFSHHGWQEFAYDFYMPEDTPVFAARAGVVVETRADSNVIGFHAPGNYVLVEHSDRTFGWYYHLRKDGVLVARKQIVRQGEEIARSGWTGIALIPHLHFQVTDPEGNTIPVVFSDVPGDGIPRAPWFVGK
jgi:murein DD-endopeptidase MepM/ murein hydrolase activator NlpD